MAKKEMSETERWLLLGGVVGSFVALAYFGRSRKANASVRGIVPYDAKQLAEFNGLGAVPAGAPAQWPQPRAGYAHMPNQVRRMNMGLQRSQAYPGAPWITEQGVQEYMSGTPMPISYMPQRMLFNTNKTPPAGYAIMPGMSAMPLVAGALQEEARRGELSNAAISRVPVMPMESTGQTLNNIPEPALYLNPHPIQRDFLIRPDVQGGRNLNRVAHEFNSDPTQWQGGEPLPRYGPPRLNPANRLRAF
jgi:hypothetical protein